ncbi:MAG: hypothetical protein ACK5JH_06740 [Anaerocolumna sp.]
MFEKTNAMQRVKNYLRNHNFRYVPFNESNRPLLITDVDCIIIPCSAENVIGKSIEVQLRFREEYLYLMAYYSQIFATPDKYTELMRLLNYINGHLCYESILMHAMVLDEETGYIYNGVQIRYETLEEFFFDVMDYALSFQKQLLENICIPAVMIQTGEWDFYKARKYIGSELMHSSIE